MSLLLGLGRLQRAGKKAAVVLHAARRRPPPTRTGSAVVFVADNNKGGWDNPLRYYSCSARASALVLQPESLCCCSSYFHNNNNKNDWTHPPRGRRGNTSHRFFASTVDNKRGEEEEDNNIVDVSGHGRVVAPVDQENKVDEGTSGGETTRSVEDEYVRKTPLEHVLSRPGMYVGPTERLPPTPCWVLEDPPPPPLPSTSESFSGDDPLSYAFAVVTTFKAQPTSKEQEEAGDAGGATLRMVKKECGLVPALVKVFDEILVNASDNRLRHPRTCNEIHVTIDPGQRRRRTRGDGEGGSAGRTHIEVSPPRIRVYNNGKGIPIQMHRKEKMYVPELLFGHLLTGSNFDDDERRLTGGRHGYGSKLANIFSKSFTVTTCDAHHRLLYIQTWHNNMSESTSPQITKLTPEQAEQMEDFTCVEFVPDVERLTGGAVYDDDGTFIIPPSEYNLMCRRVVDVAGCAGDKLRVTLNGRDVSLPSFADYTALYRKSRRRNEEGDNDDDAPLSPVCFQRINARWTVGVGLSDSGSFENLSFVNGMSTSRGGTHIDVLVKQVTKKLQEQIAKKEPDLAKALTPAKIRRQLFVVCDAKIENPTFDSQMKECLTSSPDKFGSSYTLSKTFLNQICKNVEDGGPGIFPQLIRTARGQEQVTLLKKVGGGTKSRKQIMSIPKLDDAQKAGTTRSPECTLILTEGDSAKALAVAGLEVVGRETFGVFPLRGKFLNVRDATVDKLKKNEEVKAMCKILGLDFKREYETKEERRKLRYGRVMLMTDQDTDGSHIKGLVINFFRHFWPKLLMPPKDDSPNDAPDEHLFLASFVTPLLKVSNKRKKKEVYAFYSMAEYNAWRNSLDNREPSQWNVKYYKGLGTSTTAEAKEYFSAFDKNLRPFRWKSEADGELLDLVFDKERAADRRNWIIEEYDADARLDVDPSRDKSVSYEDFLNKEMIHFSHADNVRSIPSAIDGLKPSQRKVLYACFKRKLKSEIKVAQLTGYCAEHTAYHHGEASLQKTIIGMAQDFVGSNNINLLVPSGQFGTRQTGGSDAASPRYIFTHLAPIARYLFPGSDDVLLKYQEDDGEIVEPVYFCPVIPMLLVNGSQGIGTGWSTFVPPHSPLDVLNYVRAKLDGSEKLPDIRPYARGFTGAFEPRPKGDGYISIGSISKRSSTSVLIDELPVGLWTETYKQVLLKMQEKEIISSFVENHTTSEVSFKVKMNASELSKMEEKGLEASFKLQKNLLTNNMHAFDGHQLTKFHAPSEIADAFFPVRMALYQDRKSVLESEAKYRATLLTNKANFIQVVTDGEIDLVSGRRSRQETRRELRRLGFATASKLLRIRNDNAPYRRRKENQVTINENVHDTDDDDVTDEDEFDYLLNMPLSSLTSDKIRDLHHEASERENELESVKATSASDLWRRDLDELETKL